MMILRKIFLSLILLFLSASGFCGDFYSKVKIYNWNDLKNPFFDQLIKNYEGFIPKTDSTLELILNDYDLGQLRKCGVNCVVLPVNKEINFMNTAQSIKKVNDSLLGNTNFRLGSYAGFYKLDTIYKVFRSMALAYPGILLMDTIIGYTFEKRPVHCFVFGSDKPGAAEVLLTGLHHAREPGSMMVLVYYMWKLLEDASVGEPLARSILENRRIYIVPVLNPDGYYYNEITIPAGGGMWRKNRANYGGKDVGVDINRNYGPLSNWDATVFGSSEDITSDTYRGPYPFSENESDAIRQLTLKHNFKVALNFHTFSDLVIYPYSPELNETADSNYFRNIAAQISEKNNYFYGTDGETVGYLTRGSSDNYLYYNGKYKCYSMTVEVGSPNDGFWFPVDRILPLCAENYYPINQMILNADVNIKPIKAYQISSFVYNTEKLKYLNVKFLNFGVNSVASPIRVGIKSLDPIVVVTEPFREFDAWQQNELKEIKFPITINPGFKSGNTIRFITEVYLSDIKLIDTVSYNLYYFSETELFADGRAGGRWKTGNWGTVYDYDSGCFVLNDSPQGLYDRNCTNYFEMDSSIILSGENPIMEISSKWSIEPYYDVGIAEISTDNGASWTSIRFDRMTKGLNLKGSRHTQDLWGFSGIVHQWDNYFCNLEAYSGKKVKFRFGLLSDGGGVYDGWFIKKISLLSFGDSVANDQYVKSNSEDSCELMPNIVFRGDNTSLRIYAGANAKNIWGGFNERIDLNVYNSVGECVFNESKLINRKIDNIIYLPVSGLLYGLYFVNLQTAAGNSVFKLLILKE